MSPKYHVLGILLLLGACEGEQLSYNAVDVSSQIGHIYVEQVMGNFARILKNKGTLPSQATLATGLIQVTNSVTPSVTFPLSNTFASAVAGAITRTTTTAGAGMTLGGSVAWQQQFGIIPIGDPFTLRNLGFLYRAVLYGDVLTATRSWVAKQRAGARLILRGSDISLPGYTIGRITSCQTPIICNHHFAFSASIIRMSFPKGRVMSRAERIQMMYLGSNGSIGDQRGATRIWFITTSVEIRRQWMSDL
jgi:hypothetical protein